jgi:hypothetical protein
MPGGILYGDDWEHLLASAMRVTTRLATPLKFVEIGVNNGNTSRDMIKEIQVRTNEFIYIGIDPGPSPVIHHHYVYHQGLSHEVANIIPNNLSWIFVDGCHCAQCVTRDAFLYVDKLAVGGEICFHDASIGTQGQDDQRYPFLVNHHDVEKAANGIQVRKALDELKPYWPILRIKLIQSALERGRGGVEVYEKI